MGACGTECPSGNDPCFGGCVVFASDIANCGQCGIPCQPGEACIDGGCGCRFGAKLCNGTCVDVVRSDQNCGDCGITCEGGTTCVDGACDVGEQ